MTPSIFIILPNGSTLVLLELGGTAIGSTTRMSPGDRDALDLLATEM